MSAYEILTHRHIPEIERALSLDQSGASAGQEISPVKVHLVPHSGNFSRGIYATIFVSLPDVTDDVASWYRQTAETEPFFRFREYSPHIMDVKGTNFCDVTVRQQDGEVVVVSTIDNLVKGAAGNALQNMNTLCGFTETTGLWHAALAP
jgi:N-acetyl-gamma-glutamyl-phosphate reductase